MKRAVVVLLFLSVIPTGCRSAGRPASPPVTASAAPPPVAAGELDSVRYVRSAAEYHAALVQVYRSATARVESEARGRQPGTWAVVLDADETVISNLAYQAERARIGAGYSAESWNAWVRQRAATALPGAGGFLARVHALGGRIAIVTNRLQSECADTEAVFKKWELAYDAMLCRPDGGPSDKNPRFEAVAAGRSVAGSSPLDIVAFVGDNILDFPHLSQAMNGRDDSAFADFGLRFFVVPNPMYGSWQPPAAR
jgi:5'-nucleotidase (lipoprotein e(P4) family)